MEFTETAHATKDQLLRAQQVADRLNVSRGKAYAMMSSGELPVIRIGRSLRVRRESLERWIEEREERGDSGDELGECLRPPIPYSR